MSFVLHVEITKFHHFWRRKKYNTYNDGRGVEKRKIDVFLFRYISDKVFLPKSFLLYFFGGKCITISIWQKKKYSFFTFLEKVLKKFEVFLTIVNKIAIKIGKIVHLHNNFEKSSKILAKKLAKNNFFSKNCNFLSDFGHHHC